MQGAQNTMRNADNALEKLEGFISKMEDFHRLMNFLEVRFYISFIFSHQSWGYIIAFVGMHICDWLCFALRLQILHQ